MNQDSNQRISMNNGANPPLMDPHPFSRDVPSTALSLQQPQQQQQQRNTTTNFRNINNMMISTTTSNNSNNNSNNSNKKKQPSSMSFFRMSRTEPDFMNDEDLESFTDPLLEEDDDVLLESTLLMAQQQQQQQRMLQQQNDTDNNNNNNNNHNNLGRCGCIRHCTNQWIRKLGNLLATMTLLAMLVGIPWVTYDALRQPTTGPRFDLAAVDSAAIMVLGTVIMSMRLVYLHLTHWYMPDVQKYVVRILWMVPLYAIQSWLSLRFHHVRIYLDTARDLYEAYVIASFLYYLIELLGGQDHLVQLLQSKQIGQEQHHALGQHGFPLNLVLQPWELGMEFMMQCKHGVLQYVVVKTIATFLTFICQSLGWYGEGQFEWNYAYPYLSFGLNVSVMYALYCLVKLFHAIHDELRFPRDWHPLGKFLAVKGVVFFTWWQGIVIFYLRAHGIIRNVGSWTGDEVANGLIDYCICIEMVLFAICHYHVFTWKEYLPHSNIAGDGGGGNVDPPSYNHQPHQHHSRQQQRRLLLSQQQHPHQLDDIVVDEHDLESLLLQNHSSNHNNNNNNGSAIIPTNHPAGRRQLVATATSTTRPVTHHHQLQPLQQQRAVDTTATIGKTGDYSNPEDGTLTSQQQQHSLLPSYKPPTVLSHPMKFRDALWSSTVPQETLHDLRRLRKGVDTVIQQTQAPGAIGLTDMSSSSSTTTTSSNPSRNNTTAVPTTTLAFSSSLSSLPMNPKSPAGSAAAGTNTTTAALHPAAPAPATTVALPTTTLTYTTSLPSMPSSSSAAASNAGASAAPVNKP